MQNIEMFEIPTLFLYFYHRVHLSILSFGDIQVHGNEDFEGQIRKRSWHMRSLELGRSGRRISGEVFVCNLRHVILVFLFS